MWNILLDRLPEEYKGYRINTDFRIGIQIFQAYSDRDLTDYEKIRAGYELLFMDTDREGRPAPFMEGGEKAPLPDSMTAQEGIQWFLTGWYMDNKVDSGEQNNRKDMDYDIDQWRIYSAFLTQFHIDLNTSDMHFWVFMGLLSTLEECAFTRVIDLRTRKIKPKMDAESKNALKEAKKRYALEQPEEELTEDEQEAVDAFMQFVKRR